MQKVFYDDNGDVQMDVIPRFVLRSRKLKVKTTFYNHAHGEDYDPVLHVTYPENRADQLSYQPTSKLVDQMFKTGQMLTASKQLYDFPDGKDDGREVPVDRVRGLEMPDIAQAMVDNEKSLDKHAENIRAMAKEDKRKKSAAKDQPVPKEEGVSGASVAND